LIIFSLVKNEKQSINMWIAITQWKRGIMPKKKSSSSKKKSSSTKKKSSGSSNKDEYADKLFNWLSEGYIVKPLTEVVKSKDLEKMKEMFEDYEARIERVEAVKEKLDNLDFNSNHSMYDEISSKLNDPMQAGYLENFTKSFEEGPRLNELKAELASLNTRGFEEDAKKIKAMFKDEDELDDIEKAIKKLKKKIKEKFFESAFEEAAVPLEEQEPDKPKFVAETIFLLHKDGTLLSVKSKKPPKELDKKLMSKMVMAVREQMGRAFKEGEHVHSLKYEGHTIILEDSRHVYAAVVVAGEAEPVMYRIILKALQIMEKKLAKELDNWSGDRSSLENLDRYTSAIFQAMDKLK